MVQGVLAGTVLAIQANYYWVQFQDGPSEPRLCTRRTRLKKMGQKVMVGDRVEVALGLTDAGNWEERGAITGVGERQTMLERPPVANADLLCLVFSLAEPSLEEWQLSRFLVQGEATGLPLQLCLSKADLVDPAAIAQWQKRLGGWGYDPLVVSVQTGEGVDLLCQRLRHRISLFAGPSGVGKSSLLNVLIPGLGQRVNAVSGKLRKGRHTTRHVELFPLPEGGLVADTPGFNQPPLTVDPPELIHLFPEARPHLDRGPCFFKDCLHRGEPDCALPPHWDRYGHYLTFLEELQTPLSLAPEIGSKTKTGSDGQQYHEPKLAPKKYRRQSRRQAHQSLDRLWEGEPELED